MDKRRGFIPLALIILIIFLTSLLPSLRNSKGVGIEEASPEITVVNGKDDAGWRSGKNDYQYKPWYKRLVEKGTRLIEDNNPVLLQIFPDGKVWKVSGNKEYDGYLVESPTHTSRSAVDDRILTDKIVDFHETVLVDKLFVLSIMHFSDAPHCCNQIRLLSVFRKEGSSWSKVRDLKIPTANGGFHKGRIEAFELMGLPTVEVKIFGSYFNGLETTRVLWFSWNGQDFKEIWDHNIAYNTDVVGTFPDERIHNNYHESYQLSEDEILPLIEVTRFYTKRNNKLLDVPETEISKYYWSNNQSKFIQG